MKQVTEVQQNSVCTRWARKKEIGVTGKVCMVTGKLKQFSHWFHPTLRSTWLLIHPSLCILVPMWIHGPILLISFLPWLFSPVSHLSPLILVSTGFSALAIKSVPGPTPLIPSIYTWMCASACMHTYAQTHVSTHIFLIAKLFGCLISDYLEY